jgi:hypothetical protein
MGRRTVAILAIALALVYARSAVAQPAQGPSSKSATAPSVLPAGVVPSTTWLSVTGSPADGMFLDAEIRNALDRQIRPTLRPGASVRYGPIVPWPLPALAAGYRAAANVTATIVGNNDTSWVTGVTSVYITNVPMAPAAPSILFFSDDPEYIPMEGLVFRGNVDAGRPARLYYYHSDIGVPRDLDVVLTATTPSRVHIIQSVDGPDLDVASVGHAVSRNFLLFQQRNEGTVVDVTPGAPFILRHDLIFAGELVAGAIDFQVLAGGPVAASVVASPAGGHPEPYLGGPRMPFDGHNRRGTFELAGYGVIAAAYTVGGPDASVKYGHRNTTPRNVDPADPGRDYGDYGVVHRITFGLINPTDAPHVVYLYEKPLGGAVRSSFLVDGQLKELGCARLPVPYWLMTYLLPPHTASASTTMTMTDGGSYYPLEFGITETQPFPYTPPPNAADGCAPTLLPSPAPTAAPQMPVPTPTSTNESPKQSQNVISPAPTG